MLRNGVPVDGCARESKEPQAAVGPFRDPLAVAVSCCVANMQDAGKLDSSYQLVVRES